VAVVGVVNKNREAKQFLCGASSDVAYWLDDTQLPIFALDVLERLGSEVKSVRPRVERLLKAPDPEIRRRARTVLKVLRKKK
jgi:hypothetical protein